MQKSTAIALLISLVAIAGTCNIASAQEKTRAQVQQELIEAENNGMDFVSNASYPDVATIYRDHVAQRKSAADSGTGAAADGTSAEGRVDVAAPHADHSSCAGPTSFCSIYFGA
jgi:Domain of unknown function (DUF4148)